MLGAQSFAAGEGNAAQAITAIIVAVVAGLVLGGLFGGVEGFIKGLTSASPLIKLPGWMIAALAALLAIYWTSNRTLATPKRDAESETAREAEIARQERAERQGRVRRPVGD